MHYALKTSAFARLAAKAGIPDADLRKAVDEMRAGLIDANLGGNVYKKRVAVGNKGKSGGSRTIIATNLHDRWIFLFCFLKKDQENISSKEELAFKFTAKTLLSMTEAQIEAAIVAGEMEKL